MFLISTQLRIELIETGPKSALRIPRVAVVGTGLVGSTTAYALLMSGMPAEIVLIDRDRRRAEGHAHETQCRDTR
jgi:tRNA A37 threonylcarbamoyladenosine dehydratase